LRWPKREGREAKLSDEKIALKDTVTIKFSIGGSLRFLSHQETVTLLQRALVRSGVRLVYSEGFNPRPRLSLPFPRSVGVAARDDMLSLAMESTESGSFDCDAFKKRFQSELSDGIEIESVEVAGGSMSFYPESADYVFTVKEGLVSDKVNDRVAALATQQDCMVERHQLKKGTTRMVNARDFVESARVDADEIVVRCRITDAGAIRVDELMKLLGIEQSMLIGAIVRRDVHWQRRN
jgi:radical SAM-linked protein